MLKLLCGAIAAMFLCCASSAYAQEFNPDDWDARMTGPGSGVQHVGEGVRLLYRPHLVSRKEWSGGTLSFSWTPPKLPEKASDGHVYGDHLIVFLASDGTFRKERSYEVKTGIAIRLNSVNGDVSVTTAVDGENFDVVKTTKGKGPLQGAQAVSIVDKDGTITVSVGGTEIISAATPESARKGKVWGMYNREPVGNGQNVSMVSKIDYKP